MKSLIVLLGGIFILLGILLGAFGTHALKNQLSYQELESLQTGLQYQIYHGLALIFLGFNAEKFKKAGLISWGMITGTVLFSGSIYLLSLDNLIGLSFGFLWPITPIGGSLLILSWFLFVIQMVKVKN